MVLILSLQLQKISSSHKNDEGLELLPPPIYHPFWTFKRSLTFTIPKRRKKKEKERTPAQMPISTSL